MLANILHLSIQFLKSTQHLRRYFPRRLHISILSHKDGHNEMLSMREVDEILIIVKVNRCYLRIRFSLNVRIYTFSRLLFVWLSALMSNVVVWMNF